MWRSDFECPVGSGGEKRSLDSFPRDYHSSVNNDDVTILKPNGSFIGVGTEQDVDKDIVFEGVSK